jgi:hypothetical protein
VPAGKKNGNAHVRTFQLLPTQGPSYRTAEPQDGTQQSGVLNAPLGQIACFMAHTSTRISCNAILHHYLAGG